MRPEFAALVSPGTGRDEKGTPIDALSIHIGALVAPWSRAFMAWTSKLCLRCNPVLGRYMGEGDAIKSLRLVTLASGTSAEFEVPHGVTAAPFLVTFGHT